MPVEGWSTSSFEVIERILQAMRFNLRGREIRNSRDSGAWGWSVAVQSRVRTEKLFASSLGEERLMILTTASTRST